MYLLSGPLLQCVAEEDLECIPPCWSSMLQVVYLPTFLSDNQILLEHPNVLKLQQSKPASFHVLLMALISWFQTPSMACRQPPDWTIATSQGSHAYRKCCPHAGGAVQGGPWAMRREPDRMMSALLS